MGRIQSIEKSIVLTVFIFQVWREHISKFYEKGLGFNKVKWKRQEWIIILLRNTHGKLVLEMRLHTCQIIHSYSNSSNTIDTTLHSKLHAISIFDTIIFITYSSEMLFTKVADDRENNSGMQNCFGLSPKETTCVSEWNLRRL